MCPSFIGTSSAPSAEWGLATPGPRGTKGYKLCGVGCGWGGVACVWGSLVCNLLPSDSFPECTPFSVVHFLGHSHQGSHKAVLSPNTFLVTS